jgi:hypothetical protein
VVGLAAGSYTAAAEVRPRGHCQQGAGAVIERGNDPKNDPKEWAQAGEPEVLVILN